MLAPIALSALIALGAIGAPRHRGFSRTRVAAGPSIRVAFSGSGNTGTVTGATLVTSRSTTRTCMSDSGVLVTLAANAPCIRSGGVEVFGTGTNLGTLSEQLDNAAWSKFGTGVATAPVVTADAAAAPDGTTTAERVDYSAVPVGTNYSLLDGPTVTVTPGATYTISIYARTLTGTATINFVGSAASWVVPVTITTTWQRISAQVVAPGGTYALRIGYDGRGTGAAASAAATSVYLWGGQVELGAPETPYIPTAATSVTRNFDNVRFTAAWWPINGTGSVTFKYTPNWSTSPATMPASAPFLYLTLNAGQGSYLTYANSTGPLFGVLGGASGNLTMQSGSLTWVAGQTYSLGLSWTTVNRTITRDGLSVVSINTGTAGTTTSANPGTVWLGSNGGTSQAASGIISDFTVTE